MQLEKKQNKGKFSLRDNLLLAGLTAGIILIIISISILLNIRYTPRKSEKKSGILYYENIFTSDQKFIFIPQNISHDYFKSFLYYYSNGFLEKAKSLLENIIKENNSKTELTAAYNNLGNISDILNQHKQAVYLYKQALRLDKKNGHLYFNYAVSLYTHKQEHKSVKYFLLAEKFSKKLYKNDLILGNIFYEKKDYKKTLEYYKKIPKKSSFYRQAQYNTALVYYNLNRKSSIRKSKKIMQNLITQRDTVAYLSSLFLGNEAFTHQNFSAAEDYYKIAVTINTQNYTAFYNLGILQRAEKKYKKAISYFQKAAEHYQNFNIYKNIGDLFYLSGENQKGILYLQETAQFSNNTEISSLLADLYYKEQMYSEAFELYDTICRTGSKSEKKIALMNSGNILFLLKNYFRAVQYYNQALILDPNDSRIYYNLGMAFFSLKQYSHAIENFEKSLSLNPDNDNAKLQILLSYQHLQQLQKAINKCKEIISDDDNPLFQYFLAVLLFDNKNLQETKTLLESLVTEDIPYLDNVYFLLGVIYNEQHQYEKAIYYYDNALSENPKFISAFFNKGISLYFQGNFKQSIAVLTKFITLTKNNYSIGQAYFNIGNAYFRLREYKIAYQYYQRALQYIPDSNEIIYNRDLIQKRLSHNL